MLVGVSFKHIMLEPIESRYVVILQSDGGCGRFLKFNVGKTEGEAVESYLNAIQPPRPMTHDMLSAIFSLSDKVVLKHIIIDGCEGGVFYAKMILNINGDDMQVDCRPSDAIAVGIRLNVPIFVETCLLEKYGELYG